MTHADNCGCGSWIHHWRKYSWKNTTVCQAEGCSRSDITGAQVIKEIRYDNRPYIVPFCQKHNITRGSIQLAPITVLIPAKIGRFCGQ